LAKATVSGLQKHCWQFTKTPLAVGKNTIGGLQKHRWQFAKTLLAVGNK
jgi:hypothetical protein